MNGESSLEQRTRTIDFHSDFICSKKLVEKFARGSFTIERSSGVRKSFNQDSFLKAVVTLGDGRALYGGNLSCVSLAVAINLV